MLISTICLTVKKIHPSKFSSLNISANKPYYGLFGHKNNLFTKNKDGNLIGISLTHKPKIMFHDLSIADSNLDHMAGSDTTGHFVYISSKYQKNIR